MTEQSNFYELLRVSRSAPPEVIHAAYRTLMATLKKHPDLGGDPEEAVLINTAYEVLSDTARRAAYDADLDTESPPSTRTRGEERRRAPRHDVNATISYCLAHDGRWYSARVKDVSAIGAKLLAREPLGKGQEIVIACPNVASQALRGTIRWSRMYHPSLFERVYEAGVEFGVAVDDIDKRFSF